MMMQVNGVPFTYAQLVNDLAEAVVAKLHSPKGRQMMEDQCYISQNQAFKEFGKGNVLRWRRTLKVIPKVRPGKIEYWKADLRREQEKEQDYFSE